MPVTSFDGVKLMPDQGVGMGTPPTIESMNDADKASDAEMDAALDSIMDSREASEPAAEQEAPRAPKEGRSRDATGKFTSKSAETEEVEPTAASTPDANTDEYRSALRSLQRDKVPQKVLDTLSPDEVIAWGGDRAKNHLDVDRIQSRNAELERAKELLGQADDTAEAAAEDEKSVLDEALGEFEQYFGEDAVGPLKAFGEAILKQASNGQTVQKEQLAQLVGRMQVQERNEARAGLTERWDLSDDSRWQAALDYASSDANTYGSITEGLQAACRQLFADDNIDGLSAKLSTEHGKRSLGQPTTEHRTSPVGEKSDEDLEDALLDNILDGRDEDATRVGRQIGNRSRRGAYTAGRVGM